MEEIIWNAGRFAEYWAFDKVESRGGWDETEGQQDGLKENTYFALYSAWFWPCSANQLEVPYDCYFANIKTDGDVSNL